MKRPFIGVAAVVALVAGGFGLRSALQPSTSELFVRDCEEVLAKRLAAPATYQRVDASEQMRSKTTFEEFMDIDSPVKVQMTMSGQAVSSDARKAFESKKEIFAAGEFETVKLLLTYDAANVYGTPLRSQALCSQIVDRGGTVSAGVLSGTRIDGFDRIGWSVYQVWKLNQ